ncbi:MAG: T9SS type A sorting domain-containing protein [Cryomorphaceae bacterium]|nr:T9SS type A sorting domain-containing protein [Flavobacteriales bacterium]
MKNYLLPAVALFAAQGLSAQIENGNFDHWVEKETYQQPTMGVETMSSNLETFHNDGSLNVMPVDGPDGKALRLESINVGNETIPGFFITGNVPDQEGEGLVFGGGVPLTDSNISGVSFSIRHEIDASSPGFVIVQFKANGVPVGEGNMGAGTMMVPIAGVAEWQDINIQFENGFETTPDQCVFAVASGDLLGDDQSFPVGSFIEVDNLNFISSTGTEGNQFITEDEISVNPAAQVFPGGNFENWTDVAAELTPAGVLVQFDPFTTTYERTEDASSGMYALALNTVGGDGWSNPTKAVFAEGELDNAVPYIEINESHRSVSFAYKFEAEDDKASAVVHFFAQTGDGSFDEVFDKEFILEPTDQYTVVEYTFREDLEALLPMRGSMAEVTHVSIEFNSGIWAEGNTPKAGSVLKVDEVALSGGSLRNETRAVFTPGVTAFPNPATHRVSFEFTLPRSGFYRVFNATGAQVDVKQFSSAKTLVYEVNHLRSGVYFFRFQHNAGVDVVRVIVH